MGLGSNLFRGQKRLAETNRSEQLITDASGNNAIGFTLKANARNVGNIYVGNREVRNENGYEVVPGEAISLDVLNASMIYVSGTREDAVSWIGLLP